MQKVQGGRKGVRNLVASRTGLLAISAAAGAVLAGGLTARADISGFAGWGAVNTEGAAINNPNIGYQSGNTAFELTDLTTSGEGSSGWDPIAQSVSSGFSATYTYQETPQASNIAADGTMLAFQNPTTGSTAALGGGGGALGYAGIGANTAAIGYNLFDGFYNFQGGTELMTGGNQSTGTITGLGDGMNLGTGDAMTVYVNYAGTTLTETTIDTTLGKASQTIYSGLNLGTLLSSPNAIVGFTGGTGGYQSKQTVSNFTFYSGARSYAPVALSSGFNYAGIISVAGGAGVVNATMDGGTTVQGNTWYEKGYSTNNPGTGLPASGSTFTSQMDSSHVFTMQSYTGNDVILLSNGSGPTTDTLTLSTPAAYRAFSFLTSTGNGPGIFTATIDYMNGTTSTAQFLDSPDWFSNTPSAWSAGGRASVTDGPAGTENDGANPNLYQADLSLTDTTDPISGITLNWVSGGSIMILAVSGAATSTSSLLIWTGKGTPAATWNGTAISFFNGANTNFSNGSQVQFDDSATVAGSHAITVVPGMSPGGVNFANNTSNYSFSGSGWGGTGGVTLNGTGTVTFNNSNTYTGDTDINSGTLVVGAGGNIASNNIVLYSGATLNVSGGTLSSTSLGLTNAGGTVLYSGATLSLAAFNGSGSFTSTNGTGTALTLTGSSTYSGPVNLAAGSLTINANGSTATLTGSNTYSGGTYLVAGKLLVGNGSLGSGPVYLQNGVIGAAAASVNVTNQMSGGALIAASGNNLLELSNTGNNFTGPIVIQSGTLQIDSAGAIGGMNGANSATGTIIVASGSSLLVNDNTGLLGLTGGVVGGTPITAFISGTGVKGNGALRGPDNGSATWAGNVTASGPSTISPGNNSTFTLTGAISGSGPILFGSNSADTGGPSHLIIAPPTASSNNYTGESQVTGDLGFYGQLSIQLGNNNGFSPASGLNFVGGTSSPVTVDLAGYNQSVQYLTGSGPSSYVLTSSSASASSTLTVTSGLSNGNGSIFGTTISGTKLGVVMNDSTGLGTQVLSGTNSYGGGTTIAGGTLGAVGSSALGSGSVTLKGGTLSLMNATSLGSSSLNSFVTNQGSGPAGSSLASVSGGVLTLTNNGINGVANSAFYPLKVPVSDTAGFTATFVYNITAGYADGMTFILQNDSRGPNAVSSGNGGSLGYTGTNSIGNSAGIAFEIYPFGASYGTGFVSGGNLPGTYTNTSPVNIALQDVGGTYYYDYQPIDVSLVYNGIAQTLTETLYSEIEQQTFTTTYTGVDFSSLVGGPSGGSTTAYVGFTGATGGVSSTQQIYNFNYSTGSAGSPASLSSNAIVAAANTSSGIQIGVSSSDFTNGATVGPITINYNASVAVTIPAGSVAGRGVLLTPSVSIATKGKLDLGGNDLDVLASGGMTLAQVTALVKTGYNNGAWNGPGIASSAAASDSKHLTALGVIINDTTANTTGSNSGMALMTTLDGAPVSDGDILVKYTYYGDANLDGAVDGSDYSLIDNGFLNHLTGWYNGDFNYDGVVDGSDYTLIDNAFNTQGTSLGSNPLAQIASSIAPVGGSSAVPEPASLGVIAFAAAGLLGRRKRQH